jgi:C4-type Zn-finger protein
MQQVCPLCNGMAALTIQCPNCGRNMEDQGHVRDYYGPYSPYEEDFWPQLTGQLGGSISLRCIHFLFCSNCKYKTQRFIKKVLI